MREWHVSRMWFGGDKQRFEECVCKGLPCLHVLPEDDCPQHGFMAAKTLPLRSIHYAENCPMKEDEDD